jgi:hypothetical protein
MGNNKLEFIKTDDNAIVNVKFIRWVKQMNECMEICSKMDGCIAGNKSVLRVCKTNSPKSFDLLNKYFE